jgi:hypothetical protein
MGSPDSCQVEINNVLIANEVYKNYRRTAMNGIMKALNFTLPNQKISVLILEQWNLSVDSTLLFATKIFKS